MSKRVIYLDYWISRSDEVYCFYAWGQIFNKIISYVKGRTHISFQPSQGSRSLLSCDSSRRHDIHIWADPYQSWDGKCGSEWHIVANSPDYEEFEECSWRSWFFDEQYCEGDYFVDGLEQFCEGEWGLWIVFLGRKVPCKSLLCCCWIAQRSPHRDRRGGCAKQHWRVC